MESKIKLGDGILDTAKTEFNGRGAQAVKAFVDIIFDYVIQWIEESPEKSSSYETVRKLHGK